MREKAADVRKWWQNRHSCTREVLREKRTGP